MSKSFEVRFAREAEIDLELIYDHLLASYRAFDEPLDEARARAAARTREIRSGADRLGTNPFRGTRREDMGSDLRYFPVGRATYWFRIDEVARVVQVLGIFFGGQDHLERMLVRLLSD